MIIQPSDLADLLKISDDKQIDIAYKAVSIFSAILNYLKEGDSVSVSGITYYKSSNTSLEIFNSLDKRDIIELLSYGDK